MAAKEQRNQSPKPTLDSLFPGEWPKASSDDSEFPSDSEPDYSGSFSDEGETFSGDEEIAAKGEVLLHKECEDEEREEREAKERKAGKACAAKTDAADDEELVPNDNAADDEEDSDSLAGGERYLHNRCQRDRRAPNFYRKWTYANIVYDVHQKEIHKMATEMSGSKLGSAHYLSFYRKAFKTVEGRLDEETRVKYQADAKEWTENKPPPRQQQRTFEKHGQSTLRDFTECTYHQFGVQVAILAGYCDRNGEPAVMLYDNNDKLGGTSFKQRSKFWSNDPLVRDFSDWTNKSFGYPMLPSWEAINRKGLSYKKLLIGKFMGEMYRIAEGGGKGRIPWARLKDAQGDFIHPKCLPSGITLTQYHHIRHEDVDALLQHWSWRQGAGEIPLRFKNIGKADRREKQVLAADDTSTPVGPAGQLERDARKDQEQESDGENQGDGEDSGNERADVQGHGDVPRNPRNHHLPHGASNRGHGQVPKTSEELPREGNEGNDASPNPTHPRPRPRPHNLRRNPIVGQAAGSSTNRVPHPPNSPSGSPAQEHAHNKETTAEEGQQSPRKRKKNGTAADTHHHKR
ncbi:hypothetical protein EI94DRAFT_1700174 [Lactarius quietus]|nr:hypothetical protein EI94DRAFT_1700174 [Lactarius quietus]